ncbi:MAG: ribonuclease P protein component [Gammaproteobacteria bacterium]|nr:MAG: ribonuclease P protein component [Gammaproteobacteria bacterium]
MRRNRNLSKSDFRKVFADNVSSADKDMVVLAQRNQFYYSRLGLAISKKYASRAVDRNRLKRVIRESVRLNQPLLSSLDIIVINRKGLVKRSNKEIFMALDRHWQKLNQKFN